MQRGIGRVNLAANHSPIHMGHGVVAVAANLVTEGAEYAGASYLFGRIHGTYRDKATIGKIPVNLFVGTFGKLGAVIINALTGGQYGHALNVTANAGLGSYFHAMGVHHGTVKSGRKVFVLPPGASTPAGLPAGTETVLGDIPQAPRGRFLNRDQILDLAAQR